MNYYWLFLDQILIQHGHPKKNMLRGESVDITFDDLLTKIYINKQKKGNFSIFHFVIGVFLRTEWYTGGVKVIPSQLGKKKMCF